MPTIVHKSLTFIKPIRAVLSEIPLLEFPLPFLTLSTLAFVQTSRLWFWVTRGLIHKETTPRGYSISEIPDV